MSRDWSTCHPERRLIRFLQPPPRLHFSNWLGILRNINSRQAVHCFVRGGAPVSPSQAVPLLASPFERGERRWDHRHLLIFSVATALDQAKGIQKTSLTYSGDSAGHGSEDWLNNVDTSIIIKPETHSRLPLMHAKKMNLHFITSRKHLFPPWQAILYVLMGSFVLSCYFGPRSHGYKYG